MTNFHIISIFPKSLDSYFGESILKRAQKKKLIKIKFYNPREFIKDKHKKTDDRPYSGGPGMVMMAEPILKTIQSLKISAKGGPASGWKIIILSPNGKQFTNKLAADYSKKYKDIILICGRYEGIDARVKKILRAKEISIGPYILSGGELPAAVIVEAVARQIPRVLGRGESLEESRLASPEVYTRPEILKWAGKKYKVPSVLLSGHHQKISDWKTTKKWL